MISGVQAPRLSVLHPRLVELVIAGGVHSAKVNADGLSLHVCLPCSLKCNFERKGHVILKTDFICN